MCYVVAAWTHRSVHVCCSAIAILSAFCIRQNQIILLILSPTCPVSVVESCKSFAEENKTCYTAFPVSIEHWELGWACHLV